MFIPLTDIDENALPRDRTTLCPTALNELQNSIATHGLRTPIEVFASTTAPYGLISGFRRLTAVRNLAALNPAITTIAATLRTPATLQDALTTMVEENDIRADLSPWEKGRIATRARDLGLFPTIDAAIHALYPNATPMRRSRLRSLALLADELEGTLTAPETLSMRQALRLATALRGGFADLIRLALDQSKARTPEAEWSLLAPILTEAEQSLHDQTPYRPGRPRRHAYLRPGLTVRRELAPEGWVLRFTGPEATGMLMESVMDEVERLVGKG